MQYESIIQSLGKFKEFLKDNTCYTVLKQRKKLVSLTHWWFFYSMQSMWTGNCTSELWNRIPAIAIEMLPLIHTIKKPLP